MAEPEKPRKHDVMISYNWDNKETVLKIREKLRENGISCWIDVENMSGSTLEAMSAAVENCTIFLMCYSGKYSESNNCQAEAEYAKQKDKIIIPCKMERGYEACGWLGFLLGSKLFFEFSGKYPFENKMNDLLREIKVRLNMETDDKLSTEVQKSLRTEDRPVAKNEGADISRIVKEFQVHDVEGARHIAHSPPDKFWIGYEKSIALIDSEGNKLSEIQRYRFTFGAHSVTKEGHLVYLSGVSVKRYLSESSSENFITGTNVDGWKARSIYASHRTGDVIVGLQNEGKGIGKLAVYDNEGTYKQTIENDANEKPLYTWPRYVADNINGDIVTSDWYGGIVATDQAGTHRFTYNLSIPRAVVTDSNGRIFGCNNTPKIHVLDQNGKFLMNILTGSKDVFSLYIHQDTELYAGYDSAKKIVVYKL